MHTVYGLPRIPTKNLQSSVRKIICMGHFPHPIETLVWVLYPGDSTREVIPLCGRIRFRILDLRENFRGLLIFCGQILEQ